MFSTYRIEECLINCYVNNNNNTVIVKEIKQFTFMKNV